MNKYIPSQMQFVKYGAAFEVEYHASKNPLKNSEKIAYVGQMLMYPII